MLVYTLGVSPAEPGFTRARIAPRLGRLEWAKGRGAYAGWADFGGDLAHAK